MFSLFCCFFSKEIYVITIAFAVHSPHCTHYQHLILRTFVSSFSCRFGSSFLFDAPGTRCSVTYRMPRLDIQNLDIMNSLPLNLLHISLYHIYYFLHRRESQLLLFANPSLKAFVSRRDFFWRITTYQYHTIFSYILPDFARNTLLKSSQQEH